MSMVNDYTIPSIDVARNAFVRNHSWKGTCDVGKLYPVFFDEVLPGDTKQLNDTFFGRLSTPFVPVLDNIYLDVHYFFVPNRLVWEHWKEFMGEKKNPEDSIDYLVPTLTADSTNGFARYGLFDYLSIPPAVPSLTISSALFYARAYNLIWNEWYRSELLQNSVTVVTADTGDTEAIYNILPRGKRQDYFTSAMPSAQNGVGASLPLGTSAPVYGTVGNDVAENKSFLYFALSDASDAGVYGLHPRAANASSNPKYVYASGAYTNNELTPLHLVTKEQVANSNIADSGLYADLSGATAATINSLRQAIALQQFLEREQYAGHRYIEQIMSFFGVRCPDYRLQRPEYLGGGTVMVNISPIAQTSSTDSVSPQANLAAIGTVGASGLGFTKSFTEHGVILGLASFRTDINYQQGLDRHFSRNTRYDYFWPTFAHLGMQAILNKEIYAQGDAVVDSNSEIIDNKAFGFNSRYDEYRFKNSYVTSKFRSSDPQSLDIWHLAEDFSQLPVLNDEFIEVSDTVARITAVQSEPEFLLDVWHDYTDVREVPTYGLPGLRRL